MAASGQPPAPTTDLWPVGTRGEVEVRCTPSPTLAPLLERLGLSVIVSAPHTRNLILLSAPRGKLVVSFHTFERVMGVAVGPDGLAVCTRSEVWFVRNAPDIAAKL